LKTKKPKKEETADNIEKLYLLSVKEFVMNKYFDESFISKPDP